MTRRVVLAVLSAVVAGCVSSRVEDGPVVFVLAGQSNMVGQGVTAELPSELATLPANVRLFVDGEPSAIADRPRFGPEVTLADALARAWPDREVVLIKYAVGGTSLLAWAPDWRADQAARTGNADAGPLYAHLLEAIDRVGLAPSARVAGVLWMQGERDARYPEVGAAYLDNLATLVTRLRRELGDDVPFVLGLVNPPTDRYPAADAVRAAQLEAPVALGAVHVVSTDDLTKRDDDLHYDTAGQLELGRRFARAVLETGALAR